MTDRRLVQALRLCARARILRLDGGRGFYSWPTCSTLPPYSHTARLINITFYPTSEWRNTCKWNWELIVEAFLWFETAVVYIVKVRMDLTLLFSHLSWVIVKIRFIFIVNTTSSPPLSHSYTFSFIIKYTYSSNVYTTSIIVKRWAAPNTDRFKYGTNLKVGITKNSTCVTISTKKLSITSKFACIMICKFDRHRLVSLKPC